MSTKKGNGKSPVAPAPSVLSVEEQCFLRWALAANEAGTLTPGAHERVRVLLQKVREAEFLASVDPQR